MYSNPQALAKIVAGVRARVMFNAVSHPQAVVTKLSPAIVSSAVIGTNKSERIRRPYSTNGAVVRIINEVLHGHLHWV